MNSDPNHGNVKTPEAEGGVLFIVSTPIGNLEDITFRAVKILNLVQLIAAEDTRQTSILLKHYDIRTSLTSYYSYNERQKAPELLKKLLEKQQIALVSDAGTPGISDPAGHLVRLAIENNIPVIPVPGPAAFLAGLVASGQATDKFIFEGFLPVKKGRQTRLQFLSEEMRTLVFYESPHRLLKTLREFLDHFGNRRITIARELTKKFEEFFRGNIESAIQYFESKKIRGEFVLIVEGKKEWTKPRRQDGNK
jgi:16S rRNA (cytidine1402-2'-O)-methyltransferase